MSVLEQNKKNTNGMLEQETKGDTVFIDIWTYADLTYV